MIKDNIMYHNVDYMKRTNFGDLLCRFSPEVINHINERAGFMAMYSCGCEMRFVTEAKRIQIDVFVKGEGIIFAEIFKGDYLHNIIGLETGKISTIEIVDNDISESAKEIFFKDNCFKADVWRIHFENCMCTVCNVNSFGRAVRPPHNSEIPSKTMLAYGSSITHGARGMTHSNSYTAEAARILETDILNKGLGGACQFEPEIANAFAKDNSWNFAWIEGAVNCYLLSADEFKKRFDYFIDTLYKTGRKVFAVTILPTDTAIDKNSERYLKYEQFDEIIRMQRNKAVIIEGKDIITDLRFLTTDLIHPSNEGHTRMGINLADILKRYL